MEETSSGQFLPIWHQIMTFASIAMVILAVLVYVYHKIKVSGIKSFKGKYDYINNYEIKTYKLGFIFLAVGVGFIINTYGRGEIVYDPVWFFVRIFMSIAGGTLVGYISALILQYYYPTRLHKKLQKWRFMPRVNPATGSKMRLLQEDEEDVHLDDGMKAEEDVFSVDYDVWIDESTGDTKIEKYKGHLEALQCNNCGFYTMKVEREEIIDIPSDEGDGALIKHYKCQYCSSIRSTQFHIAKEDAASQSKIIDKKVNKGIEVAVINVEIQLDNGEKKKYQFQHIDQANMFLQEFDPEKVN